MNKKCQVFTPLNIVNDILNGVGYVSNLYGKKVIENACGDGNILIEIVRRYIEDSLNRGISLEKIKKGLELDIYGCEIDSVHYENCIKNLNSIAAEYNLDNISWNILNKDILKVSLDIKFDFVIGNPPYINYRDLDKETRTFVRENFQSCKKGKFDYCYAFIEDSLNSLNDTGKIAYLIPNSIFKNVFAQEIREIMLPYLSEIHDYTVQKIFENALISSAILILDKGKIVNEITYLDIKNKKQHKVNKINLKMKWVFSIQEENTSIEKCKFSDFFTASSSVATLLNRAFVVGNFTEEEEYINVDSFRIEKALLRETASPRALNYNKKELIIFPYTYVDGKLNKYSPEEFKKTFPEGYKYLKNFKGNLEKRKSDRSVNWYEYGRTQALAHLDQEKLLTSIVVTKTVKVYELKKECIPYSGIYIISKGDIKLDTAKKILESESFYQYVKSIGINASGSSVRITARDINNFEFPKQEVL
ncbi:N-6 DNA methylase [Bacillus sp. JKS001846]|uniref:Eco57I restriction-modification methylase domain-containing protein n=1 Tax=Bacillus sp. JKS001846 TaxID=1938743 RepID=UPI0009D8EC3F|nr:N-6 DNA methylase [Bacillus sp. JKS001846]SMD41424.1 N-6 DNA Methylase [Bacillus sp. JKS001846]